MKVRVILATAGMTFLASFTTIAGKQAAVEVDSFAVVYLRYILAFLTLWVILRIRGERVEIDWKDWKSLLFLMGTGILLNQNLFVLSLKHTVPSHISLIYATTSVWVMFMNWLAGKGHPEKRKVLSALLAITGVGIVVGASLFVFNREIFIGDVIILGATLSWASYTAFGKTMVHKYGPIRITFIVLAGAMIAYTPLGLPRVLAVPWEDVSTLAILGILYMGLFTSGISYILYYDILRHVDASHLGLMVSAQPPTTVIISVLVGYETLKINTVLGIVFIGGGILLASRTRHIPPPSIPPSGKGKSI
ncbi:DMT family transporter [Fidelibacter multiformis]|jgi:drug/metabolite transporter (DMT)-like permease|uniref:DMT family transporter n=1 Tax=Fidelibacter multiformis TaxID=3377529 RepID=UPI0037DD1A0F